MASESGVLYIGVTADLESRVSEHKNGTYKGFTQKYRCSKLLFYQEFEYINDAIAREKQLKGWRREKKEALIKEMNPEWKDLAVDW